MMLRGMPCASGATTALEKSRSSSPTMPCAACSRAHQLMRPACWRCSRRIMAEEGKRQIFSFHIPGDIPDLQSLHLDVMDYGLASLTACKAMFISHETVRNLMQGCPRLGDAFWRDTLIDGAVFREWMLGLGRREAYGRMAHLLCELYVRLKAVGLTNGDAYAFPLTQAEFGDALGLSTVHVNRTLQDLRGEGLITLRGGLVTVLDWERLKKAGEFDPTYLHLRKDAGRVANSGAGRRIGCVDPSFTLY